MPTPKDIKDLLPRENRLLWSQDELPVKPRSKRKNQHIEGDIQNAILKYLRYHKQVAWVERFNTGAMKIRDERNPTKHRFFRFAFVGCSDILGQAADGRFIAIEVKAPGKKPTEAQQDFIDLVNRNGGYAGVATCLEDADKILNGW